MAADYDTKVYVEVGGDKLVVADGGEIELQSGATFDVQSGANFDLGSFGTSMVVTQDDNYPLGVFGTISTAQTTGSVTQRGIWARMDVDANLSGTSSVMGAELQFRFDGATSIGSGVEAEQYTGAWLYFEQDTSGDTLADYCHASASFASVETHSDLSLSANTHLSGIEIASRLGTADGVAWADTTGTTAALFITKAPAAAGVTASDWPYGIVIENTTTAISIRDCTTGISFPAAFTGTNAILIAGTSTDAIRITGTPSNSDIMLHNGATIYNADGLGGDALTITEDGIILLAGGYDKIQFGANIAGGDWGAGTGGCLIDGTGFDWVTSTIGRVDSGDLGAACAAAYHAMTVNQATHNTTSSFFGTWTELYFIAGCVLTGASNAAAVWGQVEGLGALTSPDSGDFVAGGYFNIKTGGQLTLTTDSAVSGCRVKGEINSISGSGILSAFSCLAVTTDWPYGLYLRNITTGIDIGACTDGIVISGACGDNGIEISGTCTDAAIDIQGTQTAAGLLISGTAADGILISGNMSDNGIEITGDCTDSAFQTATGTFATGILLGGTITTGVDIGACATAGINIATGQVTGINIAGTCSTAGISMGALDSGDQAMLIVWSGTPSEATAADAAIVSVTGTSSAAGDAGDQLIGYYAKVVTSTGDQANNWLVGFDALVESQHNVDRILGGRFEAKFNDNAGTVDTGSAAVYAICNVADTVTVSAGPVSAVWAHYNGSAAVGTAATSCFFGDIDENIDRGLDFDVATGKVCTAGIRLGDTGTGKYTDGILISAPCDDNAIEITGACTDSAIQVVTGGFATGLKLDADGTTAIDITSNFTGTTMVNLAGTGTDGILVSGACGDGIHLSGTNTVSAVHISGDQVIGILYDVDAAATDGLKILVDDGITLTTGINLDRSGTTGICTTAISIDTDGTTGIDIAAGFTGTTGIQIAGTASGDGVLISGACADGIHVSGTNTATALHISGDQAIGILFDVDAAATDGLKIDVDDGITLTTGINLDRSGTTGIITTAISIDTDGTTGIDIAAGFTGTTGIQIAGTSADGILISGACSDNGIEITGTCTDSCIQFATGTSAHGLYINQACTSDGINIVADCQIGIVIADQTTAGITIAGTPTDGISISGDCADGIEIGGACTANAILISGAQAADGIEISGTCVDKAINVSGACDAALYAEYNVGAALGAWIHGVKVEITRDADVEIASGAMYGAQFVVNKSTQATQMAPNIYGCQVVIKGSSTAGSCYGLAVETQSSGEVDYLSRFLLNTGTTLAAAGAMMYLQTYVTTNIGLKIEPASAVTMTDGMAFFDNVGTGTITNLIEIDARNTTYFIKQESDNRGCFDNTSGGDAKAGRIALDVGGNTRYLYYYSD